MHSDAYYYLKNVILRVHCYGACCDKEGKEYWEVSPWLAKRLTELGEQVCEDEQRWDILKWYISYSERGYFSEAISTILTKELPKLNFRWSELVH